MIQADKYAVSKMQKQPDGEVAYYYDYTEKFAELIVKECIDICKDVNRNPYLEDEYQARQIIKNIEKHFGVGQ